MIEFNLIKNMEEVFSSITEEEVFNSEGLDEKIEEMKNYARKTSSRNPIVRFIYNGKVQQAGDELSQMQIEYDRRLYEYVIFRLLKSFQEENKIEMPAKFERYLKRKYLKNEGQ